MDKTDPIQVQYFTLQNFIFGPVRELLVNQILFYLSLSANVFPFMNIVLNFAFVGLIYVNMISWGPRNEQE